MSLIYGLILHTLQSGNTVSNHSQLMEFYTLDKQIEALRIEKWDLVLSDTRRKNQREKEQLRINEIELTLHFALAKAGALLYSIGAF